MPTPTKGARMGGSAAHQRHLLSNLATALFEHGKITTTEARARRLRPYAERLITFAKRGDLSARRQVLTVVTDKSVVHTLFTEIGPQFATREGGYTRITKIGPRKGDNAPLAVIELIQEEAEAKPRRRRARRSQPAARPAAAAAAETTEAPADEADADVTAEAPEADVTAEATDAESADAADASGRGGGQRRRGLRRGAREVTGEPSPLTAEACRVRIDLSYDGGGFSGWARQPGQRTVQQVLEDALSQVLRADPPVQLTVAGRTDAGVHARGQVAHADLPLAAWLDAAPVILRRLARLLPPDVRVRRIGVAPDGFDARFSALSRRYSYRVCDDVTGPEPLRRHDTLWYSPRDRDRPHERGRRAAARRARLRRLLPPPRGGDHRARASVPLLDPA